MKLYFSKSTNGFYTDEIHGEAIPADAVEITEEQHAELLAGQSTGKIITSDADGNPVLQDPPAPTDDELAASAKVTISNELAYAANVMGPLLDLESLGELTDAEKTSLAAWRKYRIDVSRVPQQAGYPKTINWPVRPE